MALRWTRRFCMVLGVCVPTLAIAACSEPGEPSVPCDAIDFERPRAGWLAASDTVMVTANKLSANQTDLKIVRQCPFDCGEADIDTCTLTISERPEQIMLTGDGSTLLYTSAGGNAALRYVNVPPVGSCAQSVMSADVQGGEVAVNLIGNLRSGGWVVYRDSDRGLRAVRAEPGGRGEVMAPVDLGDERTRDALVVALGDEHIVVRELRSAHRQVLWSIPVGEDAGPPVKLAAGDFSRVVVTRGEPRAGHQPEAGHHDRHVVATSGKGASAVTSVFDVHDGQMLETFSGAVVTSTIPLQDIPGLDAVSPDASHLAYVTPAGSLALRDLDNGGGCYVVSHQSGETGVAGFARDGTLYYELEERRGGGRSTQRVLAYDAQKRDTVALSAPDEQRNLRAVPPTRATAPDGSAVPWAIARRNASLTALVAGSDAVTLPHDDSASFLPRPDDDGALWMVHVAPQPEATSPDAEELILDRVVPLAATDDTGDMRVRPGDATPLLQSRQPFTFPLSSSSEICLSAPRPGSWSTRCAPKDRDEDFLRSLALPPSERRPGEGDG